jgi:hypothetical protein
VVRVLAALGGTAVGVPAFSQLVIGNDQGVPTMWLIDVTGATPNRALVVGGQAPLTGLAADDAGRRLFWITTSGTLFRAGYTPSGPLTPINLGGIVAGAGLTGSPTGLAWDSAAGRLYARYTAGVAEVSLSTPPQATLVTPIGSQDFGGFDYDGATGAFYGLNDSTSTLTLPTARGVYRIIPPLTAPVYLELANYPGTDSDIDGLAAGNGRLYLVNDISGVASNQSANIQVLNLTTLLYEAPIVSPFATSGGTFAGGAWAPGLLAQIPGNNTAVAGTGPGVCVVPVGGNAVYNFTVNSYGPDAAPNATLVVTFPSNATFISSNPPVTPSQGQAVFQLGTLAPGAVTPVTLTLSPIDGPSVVVNATVSSGGTDLDTNNNSVSITTTVLPTPPNSFVGTVVFSNIASAPTSNVPGLTGVKFSNSVTPGRPFFSPDGNRWIMHWDTDAPTASDGVILVADGTQVSVAVREGETDLQGPFTLTKVGSTIEAMMDINNAGDFAFACTDNSSGAGSINEFLLKGRVGQPLTVVAQEGSLPLPGTFDVFFNAGLSNASISDAGSLACTTDLVGPGVTPTDNLAALKADGAEYLIRKGTQTPPGQSNPVPQTLSILDDFNPSLGLALDATHTNWMLSCNLSGDANSDRVVLVNGAVRVQEGSPIPDGGFTSPVASVRAVRMEHDGTWFVSGSNADGQDWVVRDGGVLAARGQPIASGASELFDDTTFASTFFAHAENPRGDVVIGGTTSNPGVSFNSVLVLNGQTVLLRESDPVDVNADGIFNDNAYVRTIVDDRLHLTDTDLWVVVRLRNQVSIYCGGGDGDIGQALLRIALPTPNVCNDIDFNNDQVFPDLADVVDFFTVFGGGDCPTTSCDDTDVNGDGVFPDLVDVVKFLDLFGGGQC